MELNNKQALKSFKGLQIFGSFKLPKPLAWKVYTSKKVLSPFCETATQLISENEIEHALKDGEGNVVLSKNALGEDMPNTYIVSGDKIESYRKNLDSIHALTFTVENVGFALNDIPNDLQLEPELFELLEDIITP